MIYRTVISFTVLSEEPIPENQELSDIADEMFDGMYVGSSLKFKQTELVGKTAVNELNKLGSYSEFFRMDEQGNEIEEEDES